MSNATADQMLLNLNAAELEAVQALQQEMGLENPSAVMHALLRQAAQRALVVCPSCGHSAHKSTSDDASCAQCMSVLHLTEGIWQVISLQE
ncbi:MAG TPA: hypothetical protein PK170_07070 [Anaerolineae bacterium]|nr:hypothetical protein [Anaerolineae bacterium]